MGVDGNFYGIALNSINDNGAVFTITPGGTFTTLTNWQVLLLEMTSSLTLGEDGNFYGTCEGGGSGNSGMVFKLTPDGIITTLYSFSPTVYDVYDGISTNADGASPYAALTFSSDGNYYGTTDEGGAERQWNCLQDHSGWHVDDFVFFFDTRAEQLRNECRWCKSTGPVDLGQ